MCLTRDEPAFGLAKVAVAQQSLIVAVQKVVLPVVVPHRFRVERDNLRERVSTHTMSSRPRPLYTRDALEALAARDEYCAIAASLHRERCQRDLLYALFEDPEGNERVLDRVLAACEKLVMKKYAPDISRSRPIADAWQYVLGPLADVHVKLYTFLFVLHREQEVQRVVLDSYDDNESDVEGARQFIDVILPGIIRPTLNWPSSPTNIEGNVAGHASMTHAARKRYLLLTTSSPRPLK